MIIGDTEATDELIDKHASIMRIMENKKKTVEEFIVKATTIQNKVIMHQGPLNGLEDELGNIIAAYALHDAGLNGF